MKFPGKIPIAFLIMNECITSKKKTSKLYKCQHFFGFQLARAAPVLEAGGKPSTWFPPEGLVELTRKGIDIPIASDDFLPKKLKFLKKSQKCHISQILSKFVGCLNHVFANANR